MDKLVAARARADDESIHRILAGSIGIVASTGQMGSALFPFLTGLLATVRPSVRTTACSPWLIFFSLIAESRCPNPTASVSHPHDRSVTFRCSSTLSSQRYWSFRPYDRLVDRLHDEYQQED